MKKLRSLILPAIALIVNSANAQLVLEQMHHLSSYPSASSIEYLNGKFYIMGDDATHLLILNTNYNVVDSHRLFKGNNRINPLKKADIEASTVVSRNDRDYILLLGSSSTKKRNRVLLYPTQFEKVIDGSDLKRFNKRIKKAGIPEINYEGVATIYNQLVISNRGHQKNPWNQLIVTDKDFYNNQAGTPIHIINLTLDLPSTSFAGISGLTYVQSKDMLLFTASTENTSTTTGDGEIGDSYIGWVSNFSTKMNSKEITADKLINLSKNNQQFNKQKIESVCVQEVQGNALILHLVADNDNGETTIFKMRYTL